jgi:predicted ABC-type ATPase
VRQLRLAAMQDKCAFAFETVMSHPSRINEMLLLKQHGFSLILFFITTDHPDKNVARVALRVRTQSTTGHDVPERRIRERYDRTLALLPKATEIADVTFVYDNSIDWQKPSLQVAIEGEAEFRLNKQLMPWVALRLLQPLQERDEELDQIYALNEAKGSAPQAADELTGQYQGQLIWQGKHFILQLDQQLQQPIIHDRAMLELMHSGSFNATDDFNIIYSSEDAPLVRCNKIP